MPLLPLLLHPYIHDTTQSQALNPLTMARMSKVGGAFICILIIVIDVVAGVLGIEADIAQGKGKHLRVLFFECREPVHQAYQLGLAAALLLLLAHLIANLLGGCICISSKQEFDSSSPNKQMAAASLVVSWIVLIIGFSLLIIAALSNSRRRTSCGFGHRHFFSIGGFLCFIHAVFCVGYYVSARAMAWGGELPMWRDSGMRRDVGAPTAVRGP